MSLYKSEEMLLHDYVVSLMKRNISPIVIIKNINTEKFKVSKEIISNDIVLTMVYHRAMWLWLSEDILARTFEDFLKEFNLNFRPTHYSFLCCYAFQFEIAEKFSARECISCPVNYCYFNYGLIILLRTAKVCF